MRWGENARKSRCLYTLLGCARTMSHDISTHKQLSNAQHHITTISASSRHHTTTRGDNDDGPDDANASSGPSLLSPHVVVWWWKEAETVVMWCCALESCLWVEMSCDMVRAHPSRVYKHLLFLAFFPHLTSLFIYYIFCRINFRYYIYIYSTIKCRFKPV